MTDPASQYPTAEQFVERWEMLPYAERIATANRLLTGAAMAAECFMSDHTGRLADAIRQRNAVRAALLEHAPLAVQYNTPAEIIRGLRMQRDIQRERAEQAEEREALRMLNEPAAAEQVKALERKLAAVRAVIDGAGQGRVGVARLHRALTS